GEPVDASASLPDGAKFQGIAGLRNLVLNHKDDYVRTVAEKLLAYGIGRGIEYDDLPAIRKIARESAPGDYHWSSMILGVVRSTPFSMGIVRGEAQAPQRAASRRKAQAPQRAASRRKAQAPQRAASRRKAQAPQRAASREEARP